MNEIGKYCIVLLPDDSTLDLIDRIRKKYSNQIEIPSTPAHITLRESFFTSKINECADSLKKSYHGIFPLEIKIDRLELFSNRYLVLKVKKNDGLSALHETVMKSSQAFVEEVRPYLPKEALNSVQKEYLLKYNNPYVFDYYNPHITIGKIIGDDFSLGKLKRTAAKSRFSVNSITIIDKLRNQIYLTID